MSKRLKECCNSQAAVVESVLFERDRQDAKWGAQRHLNPHLWHSILSEEVGEAAEATLKLEEGKHYNALREELVQIAAVAIATLEDFDEQMRTSGRISVGRL